METNRGLAGVLPPAGQISEKWYLLWIFDNFGEFFVCLSSRGLAGVLPPAGQSFEKLHFLEKFINFGESFGAFRAGV